MNRRNLAISETKSIDYLNIGMIFVAWSFALIVPIPLFLFSYAVLGPLHYLTEISWLHDRSYFIRERWGIIGFVTASALVTALVLWGGVLPTLVYFLFGSALILVTVSGRRMKILFWGFLVVTSIAFSLFQVPFFTLLFFLFVPTVIHVFFFTGMFMLSGSLKSNSFPGMMGFLIFLLAAGSLFVIVPDRGALSSGGYIFESYRPFVHVNEALIGILSSDVGARLEGGDIFNSTLGQGVMQFLAFAYTYHYLNWFAKVRVIGWNGISSLRRTAIVVGWLSAVSVYAYDYRIGIWALVFLSFLHVLLEFPLNSRSFIDVGRRIAFMFRPRTAGM